RAGAMRLTGRAREHGRTLCRENVEQRLRSCGQPGRQAVVDLKLARGTRGGAADGSSISEGSDKARGQEDVVPGQPSSAAFHRAAKACSTRAPGPRHTRQSQKQECSNRTEDPSLKRHDASLWCCSAMVSLSLARPFECRRATTRSRSFTYPSAPGDAERKRPQS